MTGLALDRLFTSLPDGLRSDLVSSYYGIETNFRECRWEPSALNGGKLCEVVYSILRGHVDGSYPTRAGKPVNMVDACRLLEQAGSGFSRSVRVQIPRMLIALYEIRNNRGVGHVGADVDPNQMDALCVLQMSKWIMGELVRVLHGVSTVEAQAAVNALSNRKVALIWEIGGKKRVLDVTLSMRDKTLVLLYSCLDGLAESDLLSSLEHSNASAFRRDVLRRAHRERLIEYEGAKRMVHISPLGARHVEDVLLA